MKPEKYVVSLSGGKDSTAMLLRLLEEKRPVDLILFCDTGLEFPQMYEHLARLEAYIGRPITRLKAEHDFEYYFLHYTPKRKNPALEQYSGMSWAGPRNRWCTGILKTRVVDAYLKELREDYTVIEYVGIAADEPKRIKDKTYPLAEWGMTEKDCLAYCYERGFDWGGLYEIFHRVSCWCCPLQSLDELQNCIGISPTFGGSSKLGTMPLGVPLSRGILPVTSPPVSTLRSSGKKPVETSAAVRFMRRCGKRSSGAERR